MGARKLTADVRDAALGRLAHTTSLADLADRDLVIEAASENPDLKAALFAELARRSHRARHARGDRGVVYDQYKEPLYAAPPLLRRMTAAGLLGRKAGRGFYDYGDQPSEPARQRSGARS